MMKQCFILAVLASLASFARPSHGASFFPDFTLFENGDVNITSTLERAARWSSVSGLSDKIQVGVMPGFAEALGAADQATIDAVNGAVSASFAAWQNSALQFDVAFDVNAVSIGPSTGFEIDVFALPATHPLFDGTPFYGLASVATQFMAGRPLTNGQVFDGYVITGADVYINIDRVLGFATEFQLNLAESLMGLQRLLMHEIGHAIGLGHPNQAWPNLDFDDDPMNVMPVNPFDPFNGVIVSSNFNPDAIMSNLVENFEALLFTSLTNDDRGGRDLLYPVIPEPSTLALAGTAAACMLFGGRFSRRRVLLGFRVPARRRVPVVRVQRSRVPRGNRP